jgi:hypothetical protein
MGAPWANGAELVRLKTYPHPEGGFKYIVVKIPLGIPRAFPQWGTGVKLSILNKEITTRHKVIFN